MSIGMGIEMRRQNGIFFLFVASQSKQQVLQEQIRAGLRDEDRFVFVTAERNGS
jgi:hypothetical protein